MHCCWFSLLCNCTVYKVWETCCQLRLKKADENFHPDELNQLYWVLNGIFSNLKNYFGGLVTFSLQPETLNWTNSVQKFYLCCEKSQHNKTIDLRSLIL